MTSYHLGMAFSHFPTVFNDTCSKALFFKTCKWVDTLVTFFFFSLNIDLRLNFWVLKRNLNLIRLVAFCLYEH